MYGYYERWYSEHWYFDSDPTILALKCYIFIIATQCIDATMLLQKAKQTNAAIQHHMTQ